MTSPAALPTPSAQSEVEHLLEASLPRRERRLPRREVKVELGLLAAFGLACAALLATGGGALRFEPLAIVVLIAYAIASRVDYPVATGVAVPTQLFLVGLFALADARLVPVLVLGGLALGTVGACLTGRSRWDRLLVVGGDGMHVFGPTLVLVLAGKGDATLAAWWLVLAAFGAQVLTELATSSLRDWLVSGVRPRVQPRALAPVWALDAALTPVGIFAVAASSSPEWTTLALLPLVAFVGFTARDRTERLRLRLDDLQREQRRLRAAVRRIGDAFASNLDLEALVHIVGRAAVEALDAESGRTGMIEGTHIVSRTVLAGPRGARALLGRAERRALATQQPAAIVEGRAQALAIPVGPPGEAVAVISVTRTGSPFDRAERELVGYLCERASVAAANVSVHETLHRQALTDELTGLANHRRLQEQLEAAIERHRCDGTGVALVLLDLDDFKRVNDTYGHQVGDLVLRAAGHCLRVVCRSGDEPARYGGEELAVVLAATDLAEAAALAERLRRAIQALAVPVGDGGQVSVTVSVGVAGVAPGIETPSELIDAADQALYAAKRAGKNRVSTPRPSPAPGRHTPRRREPDIEHEVLTGLRREQFVLHYQPKVALSDGRPVGVEALVRWRHPRLGLIGAARFLPQVEGGAAMPALTRWVLETALGQAAAWRRTSGPLPVAVNVSAQDLADPGFVTVIARTLEGAGAIPDDLRLEITERMAMVDADRAEAALADLRTLGVGCSLDDFGTGHSSLTRLRDLPVDELKLDREFLRSAGTHQDVAVMRSAISLGHALGLTVIGEGVEDADHLRLLARLGCDLAQGYFIAPPLLPAELERWLAEPPVPAVATVVAPTAA